jgi:hypothetical protein
VPDVKPFVALEADQIGVEDGGGGASERRLADARLAFQEQRPLEAERQKQRNREPAVGDVMPCGELLLEIGDRSGKNDRRL